MFKLNCLGGRKERGREHSLGEEGEWLAVVHLGVNLCSELLSLTVSGQLAVNGPLAQIFDPHTPFPRHHGVLHSLMHASTYNPSGISQINTRHPPQVEQVSTVSFMLNRVEVSGAVPKV